ncbi:CHAT domain-containing protein [Actinomadura geliboluensis]
MNVTPEAALPPGTARLRVDRTTIDGQQLFALTGTCCCGIELPYTATRAHSRPGRLSIGTLISGHAGGESPAATYLRLQSWSRTKVELQAWLSQLRRAHDEDLHLIIWDDTDFDIPWELLWTSPPDLGDDLDDGWLGALLPISRWTTIRTTRDLGPERRPEHSCSGQVLTYIDTTMERDKKLFVDLAISSADTIDALVSQLEQPGAPTYGLVYVAAHGDHQAKGSQSWAAGLTVQDIDARRFRRIERQTPLVFFNVCQSARLDFDPELNDDTLRGFAEIFLRAGAPGFIGCLGYVSKDSGYDVAETLLAEFSGGTDQSVAALLRDYRRRIVGRSPQPVRATDDETAPQLLPLFWAFMYVYYGNPATMVRLDKKGDTP